MTFRMVVRLCLDLSAIFAENFNKNMGMVREEV